MNDKHLLVYDSEKKLCGAIMDLSNTQQKQVENVLSQLSATWKLFKRGKLVLLIPCLCGQSTAVYMIGDNNANGKSICECGRHITLYLRRHKE